MCTPFCYNLIDGQEGLLNLVISVAICFLIAQLFNEVAFHIEVYVLYGNQFDELQI